MRSPSKGVAEFQSLLRGNWWNVSTPPDPFMAAFSFLPALPREEAAAALRNRAIQLRAGVEQLQAAQKADWADNKPVFVSLDVGADHRAVRGGDPLV